MVYIDTDLDVLLFCLQDTDVLDIAYIKDARNGKCTKMPKVS